MKTINLIALLALFAALGMRAQVVNPSGPGSVATLACPSAPSSFPRAPNGGVCSSAGTLYVCINASGCIGGSDPADWTPSGMVSDAKSRQGFAVPQFHTLQTTAAYPINTAGLVAQYNLQSLAGGTTSVTNSVSGGPALTLVGSPTLGTNGVSFAGSQYGVTASTLSTIALNTEWTMLAVGIFNGGPNAGRVLSMAATADQLHFAQVYYGGGAGQMYPESRNGATDNAPNTYMSAPSTGTQLVGISMVSRWGNVRETRLDNGAFVETGNAGATGAPLASVACSVRQTASCVAGGTTVIAYLMIWSRALSDLEMQQAYAWLNSYGLPGTTPLLVAPTAILPSLTTTLINNGLSPTPPMGWTTWFAYSTAYTDALVRTQAAALVSTGMAALGYKWVEISEGWSTTRDRTGIIQANATMFPSGMASLVTYIHSLGLKAVAYAGGGEQTCGGHVGSFGYEIQDIQQFADWGFDGLKLDNCQTSNQYGVAFGLPGQSTTSTYNYSAMHSIYQFWGLGLRATGRAFLYNTSAGPNYNVQTWGSSAGGNYWRYAADVAGWTTLNAIFDLQTGLPALAGPTLGWNDSDYLACQASTLEVVAITDTQCQTQVSMWAMFASPLIAGTDLTAMDSATSAAFLNTDIIAVDQDALGISAFRAQSASCGSATCEVWARQLVGTNTCAIALLNRASTSQSITATFATIAGVVAACGSGPYTTTRDLWAHSSLGTLTTSYTATVPAYGAAVIKVAP
jgi:alpha-galactosidase